MNLLVIHRPERKASPAHGWPGADVSARKRRANAYMRDGLAHYDATEPIPFFCECDGPQCYRPVWLRSAEYDERRADADWRPTAEHDDADLPVDRAVALGR